MRSVVAAAIESFNGWLASERAFVQAVTLTLVWSVLAATGIDQHGFWFTYTATAISFIALFAIASISGRGSAKVDAALVQIDAVVDQLLVASETLLKLAISEAHLQESVLAQSEAIIAALEELRSTR